MGRLQNNPSIGWVHPKSTHAHPLAWGNNHDHPVDGLAIQFCYWQTTANLGTFIFCPDAGLVWSGQVRLGQVRSSQVN
jgi:hypothetical protein